ncbi:MAG: hypothetical protein HY370_03735 [Proteobacteria bacterium]|nr:hypothetical protein [Pseudomonadota bacterium]
MSDSGFSQPPSSGGKPVLPQMPPGRGEGDRAARVESTAGELRDVRKPTRVQGEVTRHNRDGTISIKTDEGEIEARLRGREPPPAEGQRVEIDIPPGKPPRQVIIRSVPVVEQAHQGAQQARGDEPERASPPAAGYPRTLPLLPEHERSPEVSAPLPEKILQPGDAVRLQPLPPGQEVVLPRASDIVAAAVTRIVESVSFKAAQRVAGETADQAPPAAPQTAPSSTIFSPAPSQKETMIFLPVSSVAPLPVLASVADAFPVHAAPATGVPPVRQEALLRQIVRTIAQPFALPPQKPAATAGKVFTPALLLLDSPAGSKAIQNAAQDFHLVLSPAAAANSPSGPSAPQAASPPVPLPGASALPPLPRLHHLLVKIAIPAPLVTAQTFLSAPSILSAPAAIVSAPVAAEKGVSGGNQAPALPARDVRIASVSPPPAVLLYPSSASGGKTPGAVSDPAPAPQNPHLPSLEFSVHVPPGKNHAVIKAELATAAAEGKDIVAGDPRHIRAQVTGMMSGPQNAPVVSVRMPGMPSPVSFVFPFDAPNFLPGTALELIPQPGISPSYAPRAAALAASGKISLFPPSFSAPFPAPTPPWPLFGQFEWPALEELQQVIVQQQASLRVAQTIIAQTAPNAAHPARIPAAALFFLAAVRAGDLAGWLGERVTDALRRAGREDVITRVSRDFAGLNKTSSEPLSQDWRGLALPLSWQDELHKMMLYYRRDRGSGDDEAGDIRGTRFIFDLNLSRMGAVQLDGFHRTKRLDLIIRTKTPLAAVMQQAMRRAYAGALEQTDLSGELAFQNKPGQFVKIELPGGENFVSV